MWGLSRLQTDYSLACRIVANKNRNATVLAPLYRCLILVVTAKSLLKKVQNSLSSFQFNSQAISAFVFSFPRFIAQLYSAAPDLPLVPPSSCGMLAALPSARPSALAEAQARGHTL